MYARAFGLNQEHSPYSYTAYRIIIIGAGAAGIAAGSKLHENGFKNVEILEAEDRIGGRINTIPFADGFVDMGAQW